MNRKTKRLYLLISPEGKRQGSTFKLRQTNIIRNGTMGWSMSAFKILSYIRIKSSWYKCRWALSGI